MNIMTIKYYHLFYLYAESPENFSLAVFKVKYLLMRGDYEMKYKRIIFISLLLSLISLMCLFVFAEKEVLPILTWDRTYGESDKDLAKSLIQTTDGGYAVAGYTLSKGAGAADLWVIKLDHQGNMIWDRTYGGSGDDLPACLIQTTDGGYAVAGYPLSKGAGGADFWVIKLDHQGNMIWDRTYGGSGDSGFSCFQAFDPFRGFDISFFFTQACAF